MAAMLQRERVASDRLHSVITRRDAEIEMLTKDNRSKSAALDELRARELRHLERVCTNIIFFKMFYCLVKPYYYHKTINIFFINLIFKSYLNTCILSTYTFLIKYLMINIKLLVQIETRFLFPIIFYFLIKFIHLPCFHSSLD